MLIEPKVLKGFRDSLPGKEIQRKKTKIRQERNWSLELLEISILSLIHVRMKA